MFLHSIQCSFGVMYTYVLTEVTLLVMMWCWLFYRLSPESHPSIQVDRVDRCDFRVLLSVRNTAVSSVVLLDIYSHCVAFQFILFFPSWNDYQVYRILQKTIYYCLQFQELPLLMCSIDSIHLVITDICQEPFHQFQRLNILPSWISLVWGHSLLKPATFLTSSTYVIKAG